MCPGPSWLFCFISIFLSPFLCPENGFVLLVCGCASVGQRCRAAKELRQLLIELPHCKCQLGSETRMWTMDEHCQPQNEQVDCQLICISSPLSLPLSLALSLSVWEWLCCHLILSNRSIHQDRHCCSFWSLWKCQLMLVLIELLTETRLSRS